MEKYLLTSINSENCSVEATIMYNAYDKMRSQVKYYYDNVYGCGTCKYKGYCQNVGLRDCYRIKQYSNWKDKCWMKEVLKYVSVQ